MRPPCWASPFWGSWPWFRDGGAFGNVRPVTAPADIPGADETLKAVFARFRAAPESPVFEELAEALLARGHANEALQITEHGLQKIPTHVGGRIQRAAALIALGRTRVAYVELLRALALENDNARAQRLLGRVFVEAGAPDRAAKLLAERHKNRKRTEDTRPSDGAVAAPPIPDVDQEETRRIEVPFEPTATAPAQVITEMPEGEITDAAPIPKPAAAPATPSRLVAPEVPADLANLFAELTKDLGLNPERPISSRVEVTQVIRLRQQPKPRAHLSSIDGPIVDMTQPGDLEVLSSDDLEPIETTKTPASLFDVVTSPHGLGGMSLSDEPLFHEDLPFRVDAVPEGAETAGANAPREVDFDRLRRSMTREVPQLAEVDDDERGVFGREHEFPSPAQTRSPDPSTPGAASPDAAAFAPSAQAPVAPRPRPAEYPRPSLSVPPEAYESEDTLSRDRGPRMALIGLLVFTVACIIGIVLFLR